METLSLFTALLTSSSIIVLYSCYSRCSVGSNGWSVLGTLDLKAFVCMCVCVCVCVCSIDEV